VNWLKNATIIFSAYTDYRIIRTTNKYMGNTDGKKRFAMMAYFSKQ